MTEAGQKPLQGQAYDIEKSKADEKMRQLEQQKLEEEAREKQKQAEIDRQMKQREKDLELQREKEAEKNRAALASSPKGKVKTPVPESHDTSKADPANAGHELRKDKKKKVFREAQEDNEQPYYENIAKVEKRMGTDDISNIIGCLMGHFFFSNLSNEEL